MTQHLGLQPRPPRSVTVHGRKVDDMLAWPPGIPIVMFLKDRGCAGRVTRNCLPVNKVDEYGLQLQGPTVECHSTIWSRARIFTKTTINRGSPVQGPLSSAFVLRLQSQESPV